MMGPASAWSTCLRYVAAGATHLVYTCPQPYSAEHARWLWDEVVTPLKG